MKNEDGAIPVITEKLEKKVHNFKCAIIEL